MNGMKALFITQMVALTWGLFGWCLYQALNAPSPVICALTAMVFSFAVRASWLGFLEDRKGIQ